MDLWIDNNDLLQDLSPLVGIETIGSNLFIINNESLGSLTGLDNIAPASIIDLNIYNNPLLSGCEVASICDYLLSPNGEVNIYENAPGCNSPEEVEEACYQGIDEMVSEEKLFISPNPLESTTTVTYILEHNSHVSIQIFDLSGRKISTMVNKEQTPGSYTIVADSSSLNPGIYFCVLKTNEGIQTMKMIKL